MRNSRPAGAKPARVKLQPSSPVASLAPEQWRYVGARATEPVEVSSENLSYCMPRVSRYLKAAAAPWAKAHEGAASAECHSLARTKRTTQRTGRPVALPT